MAPRHTAGMKNLENMTYYKDPYLTHVDKKLKQIDHTFENTSKAKWGYKHNQIKQVFLFSYNETHVSTYKHKWR